MQFQPIKYTEIKLKEKIECGAAPLSQVLALSDLRDRGVRLFHYKIQVKNRGWGRGNVFCVPEKSIRGSSQKMNSLRGSIFCVCHGGKK